MARRKLWSNEEDLKLQELWGKCSVEDISKILGRHKLTVLKKAKELGLREPRSRKWTEEEILYLKENYRYKNSCKQIAKVLNRSERSVYTMADRLNLKIEWEYKRIDKDGYIEIILGSSKKQKEHRFIYEQFLGRRLTNAEHIHHLDENKQNNNIENLILLSPSLHNKLHALIIKKDVLNLEKFEKYLLEHDVQKFKNWLSSFYNMI